MSAGKRKSDKLGLKEPLMRRLYSVATVTRSFLEDNDLFLSPSQSLRLESLVSSLPIAPSPPSSSDATATWFNRFSTSTAENDDDPRWYLCFRMSRTTFFDLFSIISSPSSLPLTSFAATMFRLAHGASYESLVNRFGFDSTSHASRAFFTVCKLVNDRLSQQLDDPKPDFLPSLLPNCCGVLGFGRFEVDGKFLGENGSLLVQALLVSNGTFADISAGWPSTMKPEAILRQTKLYSIAEEYLNGAPTKLRNGILVPRYILGDSRLLLLPWLVTPYNDEEEESCREFNNVLHTALNSIEIAFAKVRAWWQILDQKWKPETIEFLPFVITTACLLHNFLVKSGDNSQEACINGPAPSNNGEEETRRSKGEAFIESSRIRDAIAENLSRVNSPR